MMMEYLAAHPLRVRHVRQFPPMADRMAWEAVDPADRADLLALAEKWRGEPWPLLTAGMYASFCRTGSRKDCETPYFNRRVKLIAAALHVCLTGETGDLPIVEDGLWLLCEETTWAISAHAELNKEHPFPDAQRTIIDLFAAQTGMILSFICQLLEDVLHPDLYGRVRSEVERRILRPFMTYDGEWWMGFVRKDLCNWTPWIVSNVMMAANVWEYDCAALYPRACAMLDRWLACVPEDGGCDEGAGYWNMAAGAFLDCLMLLEQMADVRLWDIAKVQRMMAYPELMHLGGGWFANFADCDARPYLSGERLQYAGLKTGNAALVCMGVEMRGLPSREVSDVPHLSRVLMRLFAETVPTVKLKKEAKDVWLPDLQVRIVGHPDMTVAMKGGHNGESHNHNDVGSFLVMSQSDMQIVDAGNMVYTAKTFSDRRYELWNCRSICHNVPVIAGVEQGVGTQYAARDVEYLPEGMRLDIAGAYPAEACVKRCLRDMRLQNGVLTLRDEILLTEEKPVVWVFMLRQKPIIIPGGCLLDGGDGRIRLTWGDGAGLAADVGEIPVTDARMAKSYPGSLWRLTLGTDTRREHRVEFRIGPQGEAL